MFVYELPCRNGSLALMYDWVGWSTGARGSAEPHADRPKEPYTHETPGRPFQGWIRTPLLTKVWHSRTTWNATLPWAMFFDLMENGRISGLAVSCGGQGQDLPALGRRASGRAAIQACSGKTPNSCSQTLRANYFGIVPVFVGDGTAIPSVVGRPCPANEDGSMQSWTEGYRVPHHAHRGIYAGELLPALSVARPFPARPLAAP
jgi:hypothetical protein